VLGGGGDDTLDGVGGGNRVFGGGDNDRLIGGSGNETIDGGTGDDTLSGGAGTDRFFFRPGYDVDVIEDFDSADTISVASFNIGNFTAMQAAFDFTEDGPDVRIDFGNGDVLYIENTTIAALNSSDFVF